MSGGEARLPMTAENAGVERLPVWMPWVLPTVLGVLLVLLVLSVLQRSQVRRQTTQLAINNKALEAQIVERKRIEQALRDSERRLSRQNKALIRLAQSESLGRGNRAEAFREIARAAVDTLDCERASIWLFNETKTRLQCVELLERSTGVHCSGAEILAEEYPQYFEALEDNRTIAADDAHTDPRTSEFSRSYLDEHGIASMLDAPIRVGGRMVGVVCHEHRGTVRHWTLEEELFAGSIADFAALALESHERREAELSLRASEERNRTIIENATDAVITTDEVGIITGWNAQAELTFGYPREVAIGTPIHDLIVPESAREACRVGLQHFVVTGERKAMVKRTEVNALHQSGREFPAELSVSCARLGDNLIFSAFVRDLTERKEVMDARERLLAIEQEMNVARAIQASILKRDFPERSDVQIYAEMRPAREVAGDFYDFFFLDDDHLGFVIGDVSGKGVPAAIFMAMSRTLIKAVALNGGAPDECLRRANVMLCDEQLSNYFVTIFYGILDLRTGGVIYCSAGHLSPYLLAEGKVRPLPRAGGIVLGVMEGARYGSGRFTMSPGDSLFLYTDGITEAMDSHRTMYAEGRLETCLQILNGHPLSDMVHGVIRDVEAFAADQAQHDDITAMALRYLGRSDSTI